MSPNDSVSRFSLYLVIRADHDGFFPCIHIAPGDRSQISLQQKPIVDTWTALLNECKQLCIVSPINDGMMRDSFKNESPSMYFFDFIDEFFFFSPKRNEYWKIVRNVSVCFLIS
jgi:hypothetical protein